MKRSVTTLPKVLFATTALTSAILLGNSAQANPLGEQVVEGSATVKRPSDIKTEIHQSSDRAIIEWQSFDINEGEWTQFIQPNSSAVTLNRITGGDPNKIMGQLTANGTVMLVNPDGILFGQNSKVDVGSLIATPHDIANEDFMAGRYEFTKSGNSSASIINEGTITAEESGVVAFVAPGVRNSGIITARMGKVSLSSGNSFTLDLYGDELINLKVDDEIIDQVIDLATGQPMSALVDNQGHINADGGKVALTAATARLVVDNVINNDGVIEARSVGMQNGQIVLGAQTVETKVPQSPEQKVRISGKLDASGVDLGQTGGEIHILGEILGLTKATVTTDGDAGGGIILVGGDYMGGAPNPNIVTRYGIALEDQNIPTATNLTVDEGTTLSASALTTGNGGKIVNWSDNTTIFDGTVLAKGGSQSGDGGFVEVSGWTQLFYENIEADLTASNGSNGTILFDPETMIIDSAEAASLERTLNGGANAIVSARYIRVASDIVRTTGNKTLSLGLTAEDGVTLYHGITIGSSAGKLNVTINADSNNDAGGDLLSTAMNAYATDLTSIPLEFQTPLGLIEFMDRNGLNDATELLDYLNEIWPDSELLTYAETAQKLFDKGYLTEQQLQGVQEEGYFDQGATFLLNGGTLKADDGNGLVEVTGSTIGPVEDPDTGELALGPFILAAEFIPTGALDRTYKEGVPNTPQIDPYDPDINPFPTFLPAPSFSGPANTLQKRVNEQGRHAVLAFREDKDNAYDDQDTVASAIFLANLSARIAKIPAEIAGFLLDKINRDVSAKRRENNDDPVESHFERTFIRGPAETNALLRELD